jgi:hypothetical protein
MKANAPVAGIVGELVGCAFGTASRSTGRDILGVDDDQPPPAGNPPPSARQRGVRIPGHEVGVPGRMTPDQQA